MTKPFLVVLIAVALSISRSPANAMTMKVVKTLAILSGPIVADDVDQFAKLLDANPNVTTVVLWNSPGGAFVGNRGLTKLIQDHKLDTAVGGHCVSACAMVFLSGAHRFFSDAEDIDRTSLGFHGSYENGALAPQERLDFLKSVVENETGGKADPALVDRWLHLSDQRSTIRFRYPDTLGGTKSATVFACAGGGPNRGEYSACQAIADRDAYSMGIITSTSILHVER